MISSAYGVVVEMQGKRAIVLTPRGEWCTMAVKGRLPQVGEEIMLPPPPKKMLRSVADLVVAIILKIIKQTAKKTLFNRGNDYDHTIPAKNSRVQLKSGEEYVESKN